VQGGSNELTVVTSGSLGSAETDFDEWFHIAGQYIEDQEDVELASAQIQKISTYLQAYSQEIQNQLNTFNDANTEYQAKLQEAIQQAQIDAQKAQAQSQIDATDAQQEASLLLQKENQEYATKLQKYSAEIGAYQADVNEEAQKINSATANASFYSAEGKKYYEWAQLEVSSYIKNNSKMINMAMAAQASQASRQQGR
jgi:TRAP-type mannitol/chloroaromatic compound transport system substrate-binding protein